MTLIHMERRNEDGSHSHISRLDSIVATLIKVWDNVKLKRRECSESSFQYEDDRVLDYEQKLQHQKLVWEAHAIFPPTHSQSRPFQFRQNLPRTSLRYRRSYSLYLDIAKHFRADSIVQLVSKCAGVSGNLLARLGNNHSHITGTLRRFHVETFQRDFDLLLPVHSKTCGDSKGHEDEDEKSDFAKSTFLARMPAWAHRIILKADPEDLIKRLLPQDIIPPGGTHIATCFWAWLCVIDDLTEDGDCFNCIEACVEAISTFSTLSGLSVKIKSLIVPRDLREGSKLDDCREVLAAFHNVVSTTRLQTNDSIDNVTVIEAWKVDFWLEVLSVVKALQAEKSLRGQDFKMKDWIQLRLLTISARPFMVIVRASLGLTPTLEVATTPRIQQLQILAQAAMGLQNDILGWQKDHREGNPLNAVEVLIRYGLSKENAFTETLSAHNCIVRSLLRLSDLEYLGDSWKVYIRVLISFCEGMAEWMFSSSRYYSEPVTVVPSLLRPIYHDPDLMHDSASPM